MVLCANVGRCLFQIGAKFQKMTAKDNIGNEPDFQSNYNNLSLSLDVGFVF
jgi:hypothetical protein